MPGLARDIARLDNTPTVAHRAARGCLKAHRQRRQRRFCPSRLARSPPATPAPALADRSRATPACRHSAAPHVPRPLRALHLACRSQIVAGMPHCAAVARERRACRAMRHRPRPPSAAWPRQRRRAVPGRASPAAAPQRRAPPIVQGFVNAVRGGLSSTTHPASISTTPVHGRDHLVNLVLHQNDRNAELLVQHA